jgi:palmitoyltransferase ZDHHC3/7/25
MSVAQRRGKGPENKNNTVLVAEERDSTGEDSVPLFIPSGGNHSIITASHDPTSTTTTTTIGVATVRRMYCGTGPFDHHWLNLDFCGLLCALITYLLHAYAWYAVTIILIPPWMNQDAIVDNTESSNAGVVNSSSESATAVAVVALMTQHHRIISWAGFFHRIAFTLIAVLAVVSHWKAMTTDPGSVPPDAQPIDGEEETTTAKAEAGNHEKSGDPLVDVSQAYLLEPPTIPKVKRLCRRCKAYKPSRAHHCSICRRCIIKMDHHCPWVNNCVGIGNHKYFLLFVFYTCISCAYSLILVVSRFASCNNGAHIYQSGLRASRLVRPRFAEQQQQLIFKNQNHLHQHCLDRPSHLLIILGLLVEAILFGMFTACMMMDQADVVRSKITHIDRFTGSDVGSNTLAGVLEVFGVGNASQKNSSGSHRPSRNSRFRPDWLSPFVQVCFPSKSLRDEVMGYCRPCPPNKRDKDVTIQSTFAKGINAIAGTRMKNTNKSGMVEIV